MTSLWHQAPALCAFDLESSGVSVEQDRIVTACVAVIRPAEADVQKRVTVRSWLLAVDVEIPPEAEAIHGISTVFAKENGEPPAQALDLIAAELALALVAGVPIVGCNLAYDLTMLDRELRRHDLPTVEDRLDGQPLTPVVDVYVLDKALDPYRKGSRKLVDLCKQYEVRIDGAHDSTFDALAAARVAYRIGQRAQLGFDSLVGLYAARRAPEEVARTFQRVGRMSLAEMHEAQIGWRAQQQASLAEYFQAMGKDASDVDGRWPLIPWWPPAGERQEAPV